MADSKITAIRSKKGLTQKHLADLVGVSQAHLQRIETGKMSVRFILAVKICSALNETMEVVFPRTKPAWEKLDTKYDDRIKGLDDGDFWKQMQQADIDMDPAAWSFKYRLRGGANGIVPVSGIEKDRLYGAVQRCEDNDTFIVFDSEDKRLVLNLDHLSFCHFIFEPPTMATSESYRARAKDVTVFMTDSSEPLRFGVNPDEGESNDPEEEDVGQFGHLIVMADCSMGEDKDVFHFTDEDGEEAFFRAKDVAMIEIPVWVFEPELLGPDYEETDTSADGNA